MKKEILMILMALMLMLSTTSISQANPQVPRWACIDTAAPARSHLECVYDTSRSSIILFGGIDSLGHLPNDLWQWDHSNWSTLDITGPSGRKDFGMCYDKAHDNIVLYGGQDAYGNYLGDTWILTDNGWMLSNVMGPSPRTGFSMIYDDTSHSIILFGGTDEQT